MPAFRTLDLLFIQKELEYCSLSGDTSNLENKVLVTMIPKKFTGWKEPGVRYVSILMVQRPCGGILSAEGGGLTAGQA